MAPGIVRLDFERAHIVLDRLFQFALTTQKRA